MCPLVPHWSSVSMQQREVVERVRTALGQLGSEVIPGTEPVFDADDENEDTFVDVIGGGQKDESAKCEGFTFAYAFKPAKLEAIGGCCHFIRTTIVLVFILHFRKLFL